MSGVVRNMYINGQVVGEFGFNAVYAGMYGVPVCLVSGDDLIAKEAKQLIPEISTAIVKTAVSRTSALCLSRDEATAELKRQTKRALSRVAQVKPVEFAQPLELSIEFSHTGQAEMAAIVPGARYDAEKGIVSYTPQDQHDLYKTMRAMINLASGAEFF